MALPGPGWGRPAAAQQQGDVPAAEAAASPQATTCPPPLSPQLEEAFAQAVVDAVTQLQVLDPGLLQQEVAALQERELPYYRDMLKGRQQTPQPQQQPAAVTDAAQDSPQVELSPRQLFNLRTYVTWKVVARHVAGPDARTQFNQAVGAALLQRLWPDGLAQAQAAAAGAGGKATEQQVVQLLCGFLDVLTQAGYCCRYQVVWGEQPGGWPQDWMVTQGVLEGVPPAAKDPAPPGFMFQVKLHLPADIEGSIALRSEEEGFWGRAVSAPLLQLLAGAGYRRLTPDSVDEFFFQDQWEGPRSVGDQVLLLLGDPLEAVGIDFHPTTLVQDWELA